MSIEVLQLSNYISPRINDNVYSGVPYVTLDLEGNRDLNSYYQYLFDRKTGSGTNGAIINSINDLIFGKGIDSDAFNELLSPENQRRLVSDFYTTGMCAIEVVYQGGRKSIASATHVPIQMLAPEKVDENGVINAYYFARDWSKVRGVKDAERIVSFDSKDRAGKEILFIKTYQSGQIYFSLPDYQGGLQYAELEEEIANYHINNIKNGLAPSMLINMNNGIPLDDTQKRNVVKRFEKKFRGSTNAGKIVFSFNDNKDQEATITPIELSNASEQYEFLTRESANKLITAHRVTSPLLLGISTSTGFGSNADELRTASVLFETLVINPKRLVLIESFNRLLAFNNITEELQFESLNPFEEVQNISTDDNLNDTNDDVENNSNEVNASNEELTKEVADELISKADDIDLTDFEIIYDERVNHDNDDDDFSNKSDSFLNSLLSKIKLKVSTGTARPNAKSEQDTDDVLVRYKYTGSKNPQRPFCRAMMNADKRYRKEDIIQMGDQVVNSGWGPKGANKYSIWLYAGGGNCYHAWNRVIYLRTGSNVDVNSPLARIISRSEARRRGYEITPNNQGDEARRASGGVAPINQPNKGFLNPQ